MNRRTMDNSAASAIIFILCCCVYDLVALSNQPAYCYNFQKQIYIVHFYNLKDWEIGLKKNALILL